MKRRRAGLWTSVLVVLLISVVAGGVFAVDYTQTYARCSAIPSPHPCLGVSASNIALDALFVSLFGLLAAIVLAVTSGVAWRNLEVPDLALAKRLEAEDRAFQRVEAQRLLLEQRQAAEQRMAAMAAQRAMHEEEAGAAPSAPGVPTEAQAAASKAASEALEKAMAAAMASATARGLGPTPLPSEEPELMPEWAMEEEPRAETTDEAHNRILADRLRTIAKRKPEAVADVIKGWIEQPSVPSSS